MRVGLIVYGLDRSITGIGRYTHELALALASLPDGPEITLLTAGDAGPLANIPDFDYLPLPGCRTLPGLMTLGNRLLPRLARQYALDLIHDPTGVTPLALGAGGASIVVTVHDVFAWSLPGYSSRIDTLIYKQWLPRILPRRADAVVTDSEHSGQEIEKYLNVPTAKVNVIPIGVDQRFCVQPTGAVQALLHDKFDLKTSYLLYVGAITQRKNIVRSIEAFAQIAPQFPDLRFVIVGPGSWLQTPIEATVQRLSIEDKIIMTGRVADEDLPALYAGASAFVFPSLYEGFGLPVLEAMACGTPVVTSNVSSLPEVAGDAALMVDPHDVDALAEAMQRLLTDGELQQDLRQKGLERAATFTWERTARETLQLYRDVAGAAVRTG